jgi:hypothetical protein
MSHDTLFSSQKDSLYVCVSTDKGITWTRLQGFSRWDATAVIPGWTEHSLDITAFDGQTIQLGFEGVSKFGNAFGLDNINIEFTNPVPLTLLNFKAVKLEKANQLIWSTTKEWNMDAFEIERSKDGITFEKIGRIKSTGDGTFRSYNFQDENPIAGVQYYRLKMLENNQTFSYSPVQKIDRTVYYEYSIVNPAINRQLQMKLTSIEAESMSLMITDMQGRKLVAREVNVPVKKQIQINVPLPFASGNYMISLRGKNGVVQQQVVLP